MATELESRNRHLLETLEELDRSRQQVTGERNFMEGVVNSISSAILPFSRDGLLISVNTNGRMHSGYAGGCRQALPGDFCPAGPS